LHWIKTTKPFVMTNADIFDLVVMPLLIFLARIADVSIGTIRIIMVSKGNRTLAPILGFFEVLIWILAISRIMQNLDNWINYVAYAAGFATGNYLGMLLEERLALGMLLVRVITQRDASLLISSLHERGYGTTSVDARGSKEQVHVIYTIIKRADLPKVIEVINSFNPRAFYSVEDIRYVREGAFPVSRTKTRLGLNPLKTWRKGK